MVYSHVALCSLFVVPWLYKMWEITLIIHHEGTFIRNEADGKLEYVGGELDVRGVRRSNMAESGIMLMSF